MSEKRIPEDMKEQLEDNEEDKNGDLNNVEHDLDTENLELLDPQMVEKLQEFGHEDMLVDFDGSGKSGEDERVEMAREWFTEENDYRADTNITPRQVFATTMLRNVDEMFETLELEDTQSWIDSVLDDFERYVVSIDALGRKQEENVLRSMFGDQGELSPGEKDSVFARMISNPPSNNKDD